MKKYILIKTSETESADSWNSELNTIRDVSRFLERLNDYNRFPKPWYTPTLMHRMGREMEIDERTRLGPGIFSDCLFSIFSSFSQPINVGVYPRLIDA